MVKSMIAKVGLDPAAFWLKAVCASNCAMLHYLLMQKLGVVLVVLDFLLRIANGTFDP